MATDSIVETIVNSLEDAHVNLNMVTSRLEDTDHSLDGIRMLIDDYRENEGVKNAIDKLLPTLREFKRLYENIEYETDTL